MNKIKEFFYPVRHFIESLRQLHDWFPIIWNTRDFDHNYLLEIMRFKMKRMHTFFISSDCVSIQPEESLSSLKRCIEIIDLLVDDKWEIAIYDEHYKKFPWEKGDFDKFLEYINNPSPGREKSFRETRDKVEKTHKELLREFGKLFGKYHRWWWD